MEFYVDDLLVKGKEAKNHIVDLADIFTTLKEYGMELNPNKCVVGVRSGKFLGYVVT